MIKKTFITFLFIFFPFFVLADTYQDIAGASQMVADSFGEMWAFLFDDVPSLLQRATAWFVVWSVKAKIFLQLEFMKYSWGIAKIIIQDLNIMSQITSQISILPQDVRQALIDMRLFDGINLLFQAFMTRFVMRFLN
jgi:hypothetical protein